MPKFQSAVVSSSNGQKSLTAGRIIIAKTKQFSTRYAMILSKKSSYSKHDGQREKKTYTVLLPCDANETIWCEKSTFDLDEELDVEPYCENMEIYCPQRPSSHTIVEIHDRDILVITDQVLSNLNSDAMINDFNKRQQPRFR